jgi:hypothetical protein
MIEEYKINTPKDVLYIKNKKYFIVWMDKEGNSAVEEYGRYYIDEIEEPHLHYFGKYAYPLLVGKPVFHILIWANDKTHAVKIANEKRIQMIASGKWDQEGARLNK